MMQIRKWKSEETRKGRTESKRCWSGCSHTIKYVMLGMKCLWNCYVYYTCKPLDKTHTWCIIWSFDRPTPHTDLFILPYPPRNEKIYVVSSLLRIHRDQTILVSNWFMLMFSVLHQCFINIRLLSTESWHKLCEGQLIQDPNLDPTLPTVVLAAFVWSRLHCQRSRDPLTGI